MVLTRSVIVELSQKISFFFFCPLQNNSFALYEPPERNDQKKKKKISCHILWTVII